MLFSKISLAVFATAAVAQHMDHAEADADLIWIGKTTQTGDYSQRVGLASEIWEMIQADNPKYDALEYAEELAKDFKISMAFSGLGKRYVNISDPLSCFKDFNTTTEGGNDNAIYGGIQRLQAIGGICKVPANSVTQLECLTYSGRDGGIIINNYNPTTAIQIPCATLAMYAMAIMEGCPAETTSDADGTKFSLHDGANNVTGATGFEVIVQKCVSRVQSQ